MSDSILKGKTILVTRPVAQSENLCHLISQQGGEAIAFPTLEIIAQAPPPEALALASAADWLIFTSKNAVDFAIEAFNGKIPESAQFKIAAVGQATATTLLQAGWSVDCVPATEFNSDGLLAEPALQSVTNKHCIIVRGVGGREKLADTLRSRHAIVDYLEVYRRNRPDSDNRVVSTCLQTQQLDAITITSVEALENLLAMLEPELLHRLKLPILVVVSDRIKQAAEQLGFERIAVTRQPTDAEILETLMTLLNGENRGRIN